MQLGYLTMQRGGAGNGAEAPQCHKSCYQCRAVMHLENAWQRIYCLFASGLTVPSIVMTPCNYDSDALFLFLFHP